jgi:hypothetical protein
LKVLYETKIGQKMKMDGSICPGDLDTQISGLTGDTVKGMSIDNTKALNLCEWNKDGIRVGTYISGKQGKIG